MITKLVLRVLDAEGVMLGAVVHHARIKGDGCVRAAGPVVMGMARAGIPSVLSVHWCDVHVETRVPLALPSVMPGQIVEVCAAGAPLMVVGPMPGPLPPVEQSGAVVPVPVGGLGARA